MAVLAAFAPAALSSVDVDIAALYQERAGAPARPSAPLVVAFTADPPDSLAVVAAAWSRIPGVDAANPLDASYLTRSVLPAAILDRAVAGGWPLPALAEVPAVVVQTTPGEERAILAILRDETRGTATFLGLPVLEEALAAASQRELPWLLGLAGVMLAAGLALGGRRWRAVVLPLGGVGLATAATLGLTGLLGYSLGGPNLLVPVVVLVFGLADGVYVLHAWARHAELAPGARLDATLQEVVAPCALTTLTTAGSLLLLVPLTSPPLGQFAMLAAVGIGLALAGGLAVPVIALTVAPGPTLAPIHVGGAAPWRAFVAWAGARRRQLAVAGAVVVAVGGIAAGAVQPTVRLLDELPASDPTRQAHESMTEALDGLPTLEVVVRSPEGVSHPDLYHLLLDVHPFLLGRDEVGAVLSFANLALWIARAENRPPRRLVSTGRLGRSSRAMKLALAALSTPSTPSSSPVGLWAVDHGEGFRLHARLLGWDPTAWIGVVDAAHDYRLPEGVTLTTHGFVDIAVTGVRRIPRDLAVAWLTTCVALAVSLAIGLRSARAALWGLVPGIVATGATVAGLVLTGIRVTEPVVLAATLALGVGVDVWIHLSVRASRLQASGVSETESRVRALAELSWPVLWTTGLLATGAAVLAFAELATPRDVARVVVPAFLVDVAATFVLFAAVRNDSHVHGGTS